MDVGGEEVGRSTRKRAAILDSASQVFLLRGYAGASMDEVAAVAAVSKQTIYKNFGDKHHLFVETVTAQIAEAEQPTGTMLVALPTTTDLARDLRRFARQHIADVTQPHLLRMRRLIIAEAGRFPEIGRAWYANGPGEAHRTLAGVFSALADRGLLHLSDPLVAAEHFNWLVLSGPLNQAMFDPDHTPSAAELRRRADVAVQVFLAAYGAA